VSDAVDRGARLVLGLGAVLSRPVQIDDLGHPQAPPFETRRRPEHCLGRQRKENTMLDSSLIKEHLEVVGSDGEHVGRVDHVKGDQIELAKMDLAGGFKHHMIPVSWVERVDEKHVHLNLTKDDAKARWTEKH
jgi:hypothetical protein